MAPKIESTVRKKIARMVIRMNTMIEVVTVSWRLGQTTFEASVRTCRTNSPGLVFFPSLAMAFTFLVPMGGHIRFGRHIAASLARLKRDICTLSEKDSPIAAQIRRSKGIQWKGMPRLGEALIAAGRSGGTRTPGIRFWRPTLYQLSYTPSRAGDALSGCNRTVQALQ